MDIQDIRIEENVVPGQYWGQQSSGTVFTQNIQSFMKNIPIV